MTISLETLNRPGYCERLESLSLPALVRVAQDGAGLAPTAAETLLGITAGDIALQALELSQKGYVSFIKSAACTTTDAVTIELIARGVTFPASSVRRIEITAHSCDDAGVASYERRFVIEGAATPVIGTFGGVAATETTMLKGSAGSEVAFDYTRTEQAAAESQTFALAAGASTLTFTYTGQSGDVTNVWFQVKVFPKIALPFV